MLLNISHLQINYYSNPMVQMRQNVSERVNQSSWISRMLILYLQREVINIKGPSVPNSPHKRSSPKHPARTPNINHHEPQQSPNSPTTDPSLNPHNSPKNKQTKQHINLLNNTVKNKQQTTNYIRATSRTPFNNTNQRISRTTNHNTTTKEYAGIHDRPRDSVPASHTTTAQPPNPIVETVCEDDETPTSEEYDPMADAPDPVTPTPSYVPLHGKNEHWGVHVNQALPVSDPISYAYTESIVMGSATALD